MQPYEFQKKSLSESFASVSVPKGGGFYKTLFVFLGPGLMVSVGYMDPGNWATDIAGGSKFGYSLLAIVLISNLFAMVLQHLALKLGIATGYDLAQACKTFFPKWANLPLWFLCEVAIIACDLAEVIGSAIALQLLFAIPLFVGVLITVLDVFLILYLQRKGFRWLELVVAGLIGIISLCFIYLIIVSKPNVKDVLLGMIPSTQLISNPQMLYMAIGILGATVMPHNLYLHSSIVQTRNFEKDEAGKKNAIRFATIDSTLSLFIAFFINAAILICAAAAFHFKSNHHDIAEIQDAYQLFSPILGIGLAGTFFAIALLASGVNSTLTGTLAGQIVMEGFLDIKITPWLRRLITRLIAVIPALGVTYFFGSSGTAQLLILSQVVLSMQLSFAVIPLVYFTMSKSKMGVFANGKCLNMIACIVAAIIAGLNIYLLVSVLR